MNALINFLIKQLKRLTAFLQSKLKLDVQGQIRDLNSLAPKILTAKEDLEKVKPYLDSLKYAIDAKDINNIAITGSHGSGKSTIIKTFQNQYAEYKYLNISLASFNDNKDDKDDMLEHKLEISILQQMFYHVKPSVIPDSRFKRIVNVTRKKLLLLTTFLIFWILSALTLIKFGYIEKLNPHGWKISYPIDWVAFFSSLIFLLGIGMFVKNVYRLLSNSRITKLNIKGELELGEAVDKSVFNQHLEEILYFFERTDFNVVVIEDVDRFNSTDIFTKLREINILINNSNLIKRQVKFLYAIKDEMFTDKNERVKFFEFIIPIIPFINPSNASDQLTKLISNANLKGVLTPDFTSDVVTFIDDIDMRLLINIFQEYQIYRNILSPSLKQDNLFAILVYKNMYPHDFGELSKRNGKLYKFLNDKQTYIKDLKKDLVAQIEKIDKQISLLDKEVLNNVKELRAVYINRLASKISSFHAFYLGKNVGLLDAVEDEYFNQIKNSDNINCAKYQADYPNGPLKVKFPILSGVKFSSIEKEISNELTYDEREKLLQDKTNNQLNVLKAEKEKEKNRIVELDSLSIQEIFGLVRINNYLGEFKDSPLMRNLLLNGYIDENFDDYISFFHEVSLTKDDFTFERSVKSGVSLKFDYQLSKTDNLIKRLPVKYFQREAILNYSILRWLLDDEFKYKPKFDALFNSLHKNDEKHFEFVTGFIKTNPEKIAHFIKNLCTNNPELWFHINNNSGLSDDEIRNLIRLIFEHADISTILKFEDLPSLVLYFEQLPEPFAFCSTFNNIKNVRLFILEKKLRFKTLDLPAEDQKELFETIYTNNNYQINEHNIEVIIQGNKKDYDLKEFSSAHYTTILKLDLKPLKDYISANLEDYISDVMAQLMDNNNEAEETIINILNRKDVILELKEKLLEGQETFIRSIGVIDDIEVKQLVFSNDRIVVSWDNVFDYYDEIKEENFDETLVAFLNNDKNYGVLSKVKLNADSDRDEEYIKKMSGKILDCDKLNLDAYTSLLDSLPYIYLKIDYDKFDIQRTSKLLDKEILSLTADNFNGLKAKGNNLSARLIEIHQTAFIEKFPELSMEVADWLLVFISSVITQQNKLSLVQKIDDSIIINNSSIAEAVCNILPSHKLIPFRYEVLDAMLKSNASVQKRIELLTLNFSNLDDAQIQSLTEKLGESYVNVFTKQHKPVFPNTKFNIELFNKLKERDLILRYEVEHHGKSIRVFARYSSANVLDPEANDTTTP